MRDFALSEWDKNRIELEIHVRVTDANRIKGECQRVCVGWNGCEISEKM